MSVQARGRAGDKGVGEGGRDNRGEGQEENKQGPRRKPPKMEKVGGKPGEGGQWGNNTWDKRRQIKRKRKSAGEEI